MKKYKINPGHPSKLNSHRHQFSNRNPPATVHFSSNSLHTQKLMNPSSILKTSRKTSSKPKLASFSLHTINLQKPKQANLSVGTPKPISKANFRSITNSSNQFIKTSRTLKSFNQLPFKPSSRSKKSRNQTGISSSFKSMVSSTQISTTYKPKKTYESYYKDHLDQTFQALNFIKGLRQPTGTELNQKGIYLPSTTKKTIIFDLDETLVHCTEKLSTCDACIPIKIPSGQIVEAGINIRPYALQVLAQAKKQFQVIVFTASHKCYANAILDYLDPEKQLIDYRFFRENCLLQQGVFVKDLRIFVNRELENIVLIDNCVQSFAFQLDNGIPIVSWYDDLEDKELYNLMDYFKVLAQAKDVRTVNRESFHLHSFCQDYIKYKNK